MALTQPWHAASTNNTSSFERLGQALERGEFTLYLQPKVDMQNGAVVGAECLLRWQHPEQGLLGPGDFLPALAGTELEIRLGHRA